MGRHPPGFLLFGFIASLGGCGGHVLASPTDAGPRGSVSVDAATSSPPMTSPKKKPETVAEVCQAMCDRLAQVNCMRANCVTDCQKALVQPNCATSYVEFLGCALGVPFICDNGIADLMGACAAEKTTFVNCRLGLSTMMPPISQPPDVIEPPLVPTYDGGRTTACPEVPLLPETAICDGPGSDSGVEDASDDAEERAPEPWPSCSRTCREFPGGKEWVAKCEFGKCTCSYGGGLGCTCAQRPFECNLDCCF
jgi:hypothetical protein